jgi:selenocysteine lyase/cysteine desulfurase
VFTHNATHALNLALHGLLRQGDHVVTTSIEHNSVMRPLRHLERSASS